jgi:hypothetical protein
VLKEGRRCVWDLIGWLGSPLPLGVCPHDGERGGVPLRETLGPSVRPRPPPGHVLRGPRPCGHLQPLWWIQGNASITIHLLGSSDKCSINRYCVSVMLFLFCDHVSFIFFFFGFRPLHCIHLDVIINVFETT